MPRLHQNSFNTKLLHRIVDENEEKTVAEWAKEFRVRQSVIHSAVASLRRRGFMIHPVGGYNNPGRDEHVQGVLVEVTTTKKYSQEVIARNSSQQLLPRLRNQFRLLEETISKFPELLDVARRETNHLMQFMIQQDTQLRTPVKDLTSHEDSQS